MKTQDEEQTDILTLKRASCDKECVGFINKRSTTGRRRSGGNVTSPLDSNPNKSQLGQAGQIASL